MSKKFRCKKFGKRARYRTPSRFRQKVYQRLARLKSRPKVILKEAVRPTEESRPDSGQPSYHGILRPSAGSGLRMTGVLVWLILSFCFLFIHQAQAKSWHFEKWLVDIQINQDSTFLVRETQTIKFEGSFSWLKRDIAKKDLRQISDIKVFDEAGRQLTGDEVEISQSSSQVSVKMNFSATDTIKTWTFGYLVHGGLRFFKDHDELYWNAVSSERDVPIKTIEVLVRLPQPIDAGQTQQRLFVGLADSKQEFSNFEFLADKKTFRFWGQNIAPYENFTIVAGWPKGIIRQPLIEKILPRLQLMWLVLPIIVFIFLLRHWLRFGHEPKMPGTIVAQYEPPQNLSPAEMAVIIKQQLRPKDISATMIDLACRGYLKIIEKQDKILFTKKTTYELEKTKEFLNEQTLKDHEVLLLSDLFQDQDRVAIETLKNKFYRRLPEIKKIIFEEVVRSGFFKKSPDKVRKAYLGWGMAVVFAGIFTFVGLVKILPLISIWPLLSVEACGILLIIFSQFMPALTEKGSQTKWQALGFREYLQIAERFRLQDLTPETFEKFLPYAMIFGVEKKWAARFQDIYHEPPDWYVPAAGYAYFSALSFTGQISSMNNHFSQSLFAAPGGGRGVSGFGGGGFAGGGGGGGGSSAG